MIKGVNKNVIEIKNTNNMYIEKAILFINPRVSLKDAQIILNNAQKYISEVSKNYEDYGYDLTKNKVKAKKLINTENKNITKKKIKQKKDIAIFLIKKLIPVSIGFITCLLLLK